MKGCIEERATEIAKYIISTGTTVREAARQFNVSKSTVHKDVGIRLEKINKCLYFEVKQVLEKNKSERHIRGGRATREKYKKSRTDAECSPETLGGFIRPAASDICCSK